jgi:HEXXH motif-containing protein
MMDLPTAFLSLPGPADSLSRKLDRKVRLIALRELLSISGAGMGARASHGVGHLQSVVERLAREQPKAILEIVGLPDVQAPLLVMAAGLRSPEQVLEQLVPALFSGLSTMGRQLGEAIVWEHPISRVPMKGKGSLVFAEPAKAMLVDPSGLAVEFSSGERLNLNEWEAIDHPGIERRVDSFGLGSDVLDLHLSMSDSNPLAMDEAHPDKEGNAISLGGKESGEWCEMLNEALGHVEAALPDWYAELAVTNQRILPVGYEPEMHLSASYREAPGIVYMTLHPDSLTMAEALVHEVQHGKLNRLSWVDPVLHNAYTAWSDSPVRPDLRPVMGVLLAVHAFIPVAALHNRLAAMDHPISRTRKFADRRDQVLAGNAGGLSIVEKIGEPSPLGRKVIQGLRRVHDVLASEHESSQWAADAMPPG